MIRCAVVTASDSGIGKATAVALARESSAPTRAACVTGASYVVDGGLLQMAPQPGTAVLDHGRRP